MTTEDDFTKDAADSVGAYLVQQGGSGGSSEQKLELTAHEKSPEKPGFAEPCDQVQRAPVEGRGHQ